MKTATVTATLAALVLLALPAGAAEAAGRRMVLTFDDLPAQRTQRLSEGRIAEITEGLLRSLAKRKIPAIGFVNEDKLYSGDEPVPERLKLLERWLDAGHELGNHGFSHLDLHRVPLEEFQRDVLAGERLTRPLVEARGQELRFFRHPFLRTGRDLETKRRLEAFLADHGYRVAPVTVDNSEWIFARAFDEALDRGDAEIEARLGAAYLGYMERIVEYYEGQSRALFGRELPQVLLLHANALNARHLGGLAARLAGRGYRFVDLDTALSDPAYDSADAYVGPGGITWLHRWAITRGVDPSVFAGEPEAPPWVEELAGIRESPRNRPAQPNLRRSSAGGCLPIANRALRMFTMPVRFICNALTVVRPTAVKPMISV